MGEAASVVEGAVRTKAPANGWKTSPGKYRTYVGTSSRDLPSTAR